MFEHPGESFYAGIYLAHIGRHLREHFGQRALDLCDAGCQTGRLAVPLARTGHRVTGIDASGFALTRAKLHARASGVEIATLRNDLFKAFRRMPASSLDGVISTEVLYLNRNYREILTEFRRVLRPEGLLFVSHRHPHYYVAKAVAQRDYATARFVLEHGEGEIWGSYYNWQTLAELRDLYEGLGMKMLGCHPIGIFSGIGEQVLGRPADPTGMDPAEREELAAIEIAAHPEWQGWGRYGLVVAERE
jgi:SAM-dependent methyltransferase